MTISHQCHAAIIEYSECMPSFFPTTLTLPSHALFSLYCTPLPPVYFTSFFANEIDGYLWSWGWEYISEKDTETRDLRLIWLLSCRDSSSLDSSPVIIDYRLESISCIQHILTSHGVATKDFSVCHRSLLGTGWPCAVGAAGLQPQTTLCWLCFQCMGGALKLWP